MASNAENASIWWRHHEISEYISRYLVGRSGQWCLIYRLFDFVAVRIKHNHAHIIYKSLPWRHNGHDSVSYHQLTIIYSTVYAGADQRKHQSSASLAFVRGIHRGPVNSPHKWPVTRKMFPFHDVIMCIWHTIMQAYKRNRMHWIIWQRPMNQNQAFFIKEHRIIISSAKRHVFDVGGNELKPHTGIDECRPVIRSSKFMLGSQINESYS